MPREQGHPEKSGNVIEAPLHGVVSQLHVTLGELVEKGAPVLQMEAMKLIHTLRAQVAGRVGHISCKVGDTVPAGAILIEITPSEVEEKS
jgi:biotin carboxyl carrier protein